MLADVRPRQTVRAAAPALVIVEAISGGALTGAPAGRRKERTIEAQRDNLCICGCGCAGRRETVAG